MPSSLLLNDFTFMYKVKTHFQIPKNAQLMEIILISSVSSAIAKDL